MAINLAISTDPNDSHNYSSFVNWDESIEGPVPIDSPSFKSLVSMIHNKSPLNPELRSQAMTLLSRISQLDSPSNSDGSRVNHSPTPHTHLTDFVVSLATIISSPSEQSVITALELITTWIHSLQWSNTMDLVNANIISEMESM
ncbi:hypothetical protein BLNAU_15813 [Blattamonas nauphoetae]|uniref:Uncharacterized protein n=1 Tax=Blattamonas nauphoetae TaxID=2049346 RepID=A0ABQ9XGB9_9EUKA|nr:hypothetical protein BLNAU_15813 [Blattamonas nauphoetae]